MRFYPELSNFVEGVDRAFFFIIGTSIFFLVGLTITIIVFVIRYNKKRHPKPVQMKDNYKLEVAWTVIPLILVLIMFYYGYVGYMPMREAPDDAITIYTEGRMWEWEFTYPNGKKSKDLYVPVEKPVKLLMTSPDVIHSLYIPAFRVKEDLVPGKETMLWFIAHEKGKYEVLCAEYCGLRHSYMMSYAYVMEEQEYNTWLADYTPDTTQILPGLEVMKKNACMGCHSLDGSKLVGPTFKGIYNAERNVLVNGKPATMIADEKYLEESIINPNAEIVEGYSANLMQSYKGVVTKEELKQIIDYLKQLN
jgi:cytochrome c oxidase subunit II